jgi:hypothetical protein
VGLQSFKNWMKIQVLDIKTAINHGAACQGARHKNLAKGC